MKISVVIITYNEAPNIAKCLDAVTLVADEVIIVDSFSTDATKAICLKYNVRFLEHVFEGYGEQKNWGNEKASHDYILSLDADEVLSEPLIQSILEQKKQPTHAAFNVNRLTNFGGTWVRFGGWYPDKKVRLWKKDAAIWIGKAVHEVLKVNNDVKIGQLKGDLLHYSFNSIFDYLNRQNKYAYLSVVEQLKKGKKPNLLSSLFKGLYKFILIYVVKLSCLHGYHGFVIALYSAGKYLINYFKYLQIEHSKTATQTQIGIHKAMTNTNAFSFLNPFKIRLLIQDYKNRKIETIELFNYNDLKLAGIASLWAGVPNVVYHSNHQPKDGLFNDFLFSTVVTQIKKED